MVRIVRETLSLGAVVAFCWAVISAAEALAPFFNGAH